MQQGGQLTPTTAGTAWPTSAGHHWLSSSCFILPCVLYVLAIFSLLRLKVSLLLFASSLLLRAQTRPLPRRLSQGTHPSLGNPALKPLSKEILVVLTDSCKCRTPWHPVGYVSP